MVLALLLGATLRLTGIDAKSLWFDEAYTVWLSEQPLDVIWAVPTQPGDDPHPRGLKTFLHAWIDVFGRSELATRAPIALASILNLALLGLLARRLFGRTTALIAVLLLAVAPLDIWYAQEVRMYMWVTTFGLLFAVLLTVNHTLAWLGLLLALAAGLYIDIPMMPLAIGLSALWLAQWWGSGRALRPLLLLLAVWAGAWLLVWPISHYYTFTFSELNRIFVIREARDALGLPAFTPWQYALALAAIGVVIAVGAVVAQRLLRRPGFRRWAGPIILIAFALITLATPLPRLFGVKRVVLTGWPYVILLVAWLISTMPWPRGRRVLGVLFTLSLGASLVTLWLVPKDDWRSVAAYISNSDGAAAAIWFDPRWNRTAYLYYDRDADAVTGTLEQLQALAGQEVWLVAERFPTSPIPSSPSEAWLDEHMTLVETVPFYRLEVRRYRPPD
jgi:uncharacterized membrane protein